jgi:hypothetical protein
MKMLVLGLCFAGLCGCAEEPQPVISHDQQIQQKLHLETVIYKNHTWISGWRGEYDGGPIFVHDPDCKCESRK